MTSAAGQRTEYYVDTPRGLFTAAGHWFRTTEALLQAYAGPLLEKEPLDRLLRQADAWLALPSLLMLWPLLPLLWGGGPAVAVGVALALYLLGHLLLPLLILRPLTPILTLLANPWLQGAAYVAGLTALAWSGRLPAVWMGLAGFVLVRWGLLDRLLRPLLDRLHAALYPLPLPDQVLRTLILRAALAHRVALPELQAMEQEVLRRLRQLPWNRN
ncbi:hypothetical protein [Rhodothermus marinus]|uniref:hypothetical protein n=1 Tax=Rhodothermus marinus TaxID=29549 RepID=UPI0012BA4043|nr:hypothetical protein [Rhodothermus marinus]BBM68760.1 hypothetical protein RmaAA213_06060 [Rhodothermus marinus]BBM71739.1 hypothetical protein RmaAA338_06040 [Rhodothermus marinus]